MLFTICLKYDGRYEQQQQKLRKDSTYFIFCFDFSWICLWTEHHSTVYRDFVIVSGISIALNLLRRVHTKIFSFVVVNVLRMDETESSVRILQLRIKLNIIAKLKRERAHNKTLIVTPKSLECNYADCSIFSNANTHWSWSTSLLCLDAERGKKSSNKQQREIQLIWG